MPPNSSTASQPQTENNQEKNIIEETGVLSECDANTVDGALNKDIRLLKHAKKREFQLVWSSIIWFIYLHIAALYGLWLAITAAKVATLVFAYFIYLISGLGVTAGAHRLWSHRAYKAKLPLRLILIIFHSMAFQYSAMHWARDHRVHHKFSETDADPHNATRGFFFSHIGWLLCKKHPEVKTKGIQLDISDLKDDRILAFQHKYYLYLIPIFCFILPTIIPMYGWNETFLNSLFVATLFRYTVLCNVTMLINSAAHKFGDKPYDKYITPTQNAFVAATCFGEGWHNYHHAFPWDYKAAELGNYKLNITTAFINFFAKIGWAYDLKSVSSDIIEKRVRRTGDGTHNIWGWGDRDQPKDELEHAIITHIKKE